MTSSRLLARHGLVEGGVILAGKGIVAAAVLRDQRAESAGRVRFRALEHQVFEEMREAGAAARVVGGADLVPHHLGNGRDPVVRQRHHLKAVAEREGLGRELLRLRATDAGGKSQYGAAERSRAAPEGASYRIAQ